MENMDVRIERLGAMRVAALRGYGEDAEGDGWKAMKAWAGSKGLLDDLEQHPVFGFDYHGDSTEGQRAYEYWIGVGDDTKSDSVAEVKAFKGGLYAVATCQVLDEPWDNIPAAWNKLVVWRKESKYKCGLHQSLEKPVDPFASPEDLVLDLYLPIAE
jgi:DNA gyrase inhibitor GyrI